jgi:hypothetical protein
LKGDIDTMVWIDPEFEAPTIPEDEKYEGTELDANILKGMRPGYSSVTMSGSHKPRDGNSEPC